MTTVSFGDDSCTLDSELFIFDNSILEEARKIKITNIYLVSRCLQGSLPQKGSQLKNIGLHRVKVCGVAPRRVANEHLKYTLILAITSCRPRYEKCTKMKLEDQCMTYRVLGE